MKTLSALVLVLFLANAAFATDNASRQRYISIEKLEKNRQFRIKLRSKGGYQAYCMKMFFENKDKDTCFALVEAGRRLKSVDSTQQDIFIVRNTYAVIPPGTKKEFDLYGFCCISHNKSPKSGSPFKTGYMEGKDWQTIANLINDNAFDQSAIQSAVWAISNNHSVSSIGRGQNDKNLALLKAVAELKKVEVPWYNTSYAQETGRVFSNKPKMIQGEIPYQLAYESAVTVLVKDEHGTVITTLVDESPAAKGKYVFYLDLEIAKWRDGKYECVIIQDGFKILETKTFEISRVISEG